MRNRTQTAAGEPEWETRTRAGRYGFAFVALAGATVVRALLSPILGSTSFPFIAYFPAVVAASVYGGVGPGLLVVGLSALLAQYFFIAPTFTLAVSDIPDAVGLLLFILSSAFIVLMNELRDRAVIEARRQRTLADERAAQLEKEIQERDRARKAAADAQRWAEDTLSSISEGVICTDLHGKITFLNPRAEQLTGWTQDAAIGKSVSEVFVLVDESTRERCPNPLRPVVEGAGLRGVDRGLLLCRHDGSELPVENSGAPIRGANQEIVGSVLVFHDVTKRNVLENELRRTASRLEHSNRELLAFAYTVSHDLQEPLRTVNAFSELLQRKLKNDPALDKEAQGCLNFIVSAGKRMSAMVRNLLAWSNAVHASAGVFTPVRVEDAVHWAEQNLLDRIRETNADIVIESPATVVADHVQLVQLFQNLIGNAIKYRSASQPIIRIAVKTEPEFWHVIVTDNGQGISRQNQELIFDLFKRGDHENPDASSSGVGLAICKRIVQRHGGEIWVESAPGEGSAFHFTLQRRAPEVKSTNS